MTRSHKELQMQVTNPANGYTLTFNRWVEFVTCLVFGPIYFAYRGLWAHAFLSLILAFATSGISWLIYPFFVEKINEAHYMKRGWVMVNG